MITKDKMEEVWTNGPIDWLKDYGKKTKKQKKFAVTVTPYTKNYLEPVTKTVWAKNAKEAEYDRPYDELRAKYPEHFEKSSYGESYWPKQGFNMEIRVKEVV